MASSSLNAASHPTDRLLGTSPAMAALRTQIRHLATFDATGSPHVPTILLQGETGTGKGLVARVIHDSGPRAQGPFIEVNCAAIPDTMLEAEIFGFEPGAFTDAKRAKAGLFEAASGGTLFLDEVDALPLVLQGKLLTALESKRVRRLGAVTDRAVDVKLIAATNAILPEAVAVGRFRADLYHRLAVVVLTLPPLRQREGDILTLAHAYLQRYTAAHGVPAKCLSADAEAWLQAHPWPGNVRELSHVMERISLLHVGETIEAKTLQQLVLPLVASTTTAPVIPLPETMESEPTLPPEAVQIRQALAQTGGNIARAARLLGVSRDTVRYRMQRYNITRSEPGSLLSSVPLHAAEVSLPGPPAPTVPRARQQGRQPRPEEMARHELSYDATTELHMPIPALVWEQKPVVVLALELTWPVTSSVESPSYDPWTEMARWEEVIVDKVQGFGGVLLQRTPALLTWVFGVPHTLEQLPQRAVHSALAIRHMVTEASAADRAPSPEVRLAVHLGAVRLDNQAADPTARLMAVGETLALPLRLLGQAMPEEILMTPEVGRLVGGWVALESRPLRVHPGEPVQVDGYSVIGLGSEREAWAGRRQPTRTPFVGRERELALLDGILAQVKAGQGHVVNLVGEPGMGKSRLLAEFCRGLSGQHVGYAEGPCSAYGSSIPYLPIIALLRDHCSMAEGDGPEALTAKMHLAVKRYEGDIEAEVPILLDLLGIPVETDHSMGLSADARRARTFEALYRMFLASSRQQPLVLAVDNLHWIDPTSEALLAGLIERLTTEPLLVLTTTRPGYRPPWSNRSSMMQLALSPLALDASRQVIQHVLDRQALAPTLEQHLLAKAEGNPFFLEELAHTVREQDGGDVALAVPNTIQAVLAARIDRLSLAEKRILQTAAVVGPVVPFWLLQVIAEHPEEALNRSLAHLQAGEFLYETRLFPEREYTFKHALTHETAYGSLLQAQRRALHARIVEALEALASDRVAEQIERLAYHASQGEVWTKALAYCRQAGEQAMMRSAYREAAGFFEQAIGALSHLPERRDTYEHAIDLRLALRSALTPSGPLGRIQTYLREAEALAEALNDASRLGQVLCFLSFNFYLMGAYDQSEATAERAMALATASGDVVLQALAYQHLGLAYHAQGNFRPALDCLRQTVAYLDGTRRRERFGRPVPPAIVSRAYLASCHAELGTFAAGAGPAKEALQDAEAANHPASLMWASWGIGMLALRQGDVASTLPLLEQALLTYQAGDLPTYFPWIAVALGMAYTMSGRVGDAVLLLTQALEQAKVTEMVVYQASCHLALGEAQMLTGNLGAGQSNGECALALAHGHQEHSYEAYALNLLGNIAARRQPPEVAQAEAHYRQALGLADELGMRPLIAHCHCGLGTLYSQTGRQTQARAELSAATALYRAMEMTFWLPDTEMALAHIQDEAAAS